MDTIEALGRKTQQIKSTGQPLVNYSSKKAVTEPIPSIFNAHKDIISIFTSVYKMEAICNAIDRLKSWWYPQKKPEEVHLLRERADSDPRPLDAREKQHDKVPSLKDLERIIYFYKPPKLKK